MSPASITCGGSARSRRMAMPDGPPAPVTRTRGCSGSVDIERPLRQRDRRLVPGRRDRGRVAVADDLERLDVPDLGEARPVPGGGAQQLLVEVVADLHLRRVGLDDLDLALEELVDG